MSRQQRNFFPNLPFLFYFYVIIRLGWRGSPVIVMPSRVVF